MSQVVRDDPFSDDEVFFGKLSLKEIKKHILWNEHHQHNINENRCAASRRNVDRDIKIIETHSAPDLNHGERILTGEIKSVSTTSLSPAGAEVYPEWEVKPVDDSFLKVEQMVEKLCVSPEKINKKDELNNTLDIIDYILKNGAPKNESAGEEQKDMVKKENMSNIDVESAKSKHQDIVKNEKMLGHSGTPSKTKLTTEENVVPCLPNNITPAKTIANSQKTDNFMTPSADIKQKAPIFKTPAKPSSVRKQTATPLRKTPVKNNAYQHIASPVAFYIKNCPVTPLVKEVRPTKLLPSTSCIPKFVKNSGLNKPGNKENIQLPSVAYKSAKKTKVIDLPDADKLPQNHLTKKLTSSLPKPLIMKHNHREVNLAKRVLSSRQEDSFADLSLQQADISVCTQKSAFNKPKNIL